MIKTVTSVDKLKISYRVEKNSSDWVILLHGIGRSSSAWDKEIKELVKKGYSVIAPDLRGHGLSDIPQKKEHYSTERFAQDINKIIKKENIKKLDMIGYSFGGAVSIMYYNLFKDKVKSMILVNTDYRMPLSFFLKYKLAYLRGKADKNIYYTLEGLKDCSRRYKKNNSIVSNIKVPVLLLESTKDKIIPPKDMDKMLTFLDKGVLYKINNAGHNVWNDRFKEVNNYIFSFLQEQKEVVISILVFLAALPFLFSNQENNITGAFIGTDTGVSIFKVFLMITLFLSAVLFLKKNR